jgi:SnoaL-like protein
MASSGSERSRNTTADPGRRIQRLEDIESIRRLKALYATHFDEALNGGSDFPPKLLLDQFARDAVWESSCFGHFTGHEGIRGFLEDYRSRVSFCLHYILGHAIDVTEDRSAATGRWITWEPMTLDGTAVLLAGHYNDEFQRSGEQWLFKSVRLDVAFLVPYDQGWAEHRIMPNWKW